MSAQKCSAKSKQTGQQCGNLAIKGLSVCRVHGGASAKARAAAARNVETQKARDAATQLGIPLDVSPQQALLDEVQRAAGMVAYYGARVAEVADEDRRGLVWGVTKEKSGGDDYGTTTEAAPNVWLRLWNEERDRLARVSAVAIKAGIEERRVQLAEQHGALLADVIRRILGRLHLTPDQQVLVGEVVPQELRALAI